MKQVLLICFLVSGFFIIGCSDEPDGNASLNIHLKLAPGTVQQAEVTRVVVTISGPDIDTQEVELKVEGRKATGIVTIPAGEEKLIIVKAYAGDNVEFEGGAYVDHPKPGEQIELQIQLKPVLQQKGSTIFKNSNTWNIGILDYSYVIGEVDNQPTSPTVFSINKPYMITRINTYHWNDAQGATPGTISLRDNNGMVYGPWEAYGTDGPKGVKNAGWNVIPNVVIPAGTYTVIDSDPATWSQNAESNGQGFATVIGYPVEGETPGTGAIESKDGAKMVLIPAGELNTPNSI